ncbi:MAG: hypothetical protein KDH15_19430 [Rhodocyclaceae bacterium]|nr:hypothetical protein [Rhodocyclaceae bacterium]
MPTVPRKKGLIDTIRFDIPDFELHGDLMVPRAGPDPRPATGFFFHRDRYVGLCSTKLPAELFNRRPAHRPARPERDVAVFAALTLFEERAKESRGKLRGDSPKNRVVQLWKARGYRGLNDESHVRTRAEIGLKHVGRPQLRLILGYKNCPGLVFLYQSVRHIVYDDCALFAGSGWVWKEGLEVAGFGQFKPIKVTLPAIPGLAKAIRDELQTGHAKFEYFE